VAGDCIAILDPVCRRSKRCPLEETGQTDGDIAHRSLLSGVRRHPPCTIDPIDASVPTIVILRLFVAPALVDHAKQPAVGLPERPSGASTF
jgi:hypothetical protein